MSLYRQVGRPSGWLAVAVVAALLVAFGVGFAVARATADEPTLEKAVADVRGEAGKTADALELVALHYERSRRAARDQLGRAQASFDDVEPDLRLLAPEATDRAERALERVQGLVERDAPAGEVEAAADEARTAVVRASGLR